MKKILLALIVIFTTSNSKAQDSLPHMHKEFYLSFADLSPLNLSLKYKKQIQPKTYLKIGLVSLEAQVNSFRPDNSNSFPMRNERYSGGLEVGIEFRKEIAKKLSLFHGPSLRGIYQHNINVNQNPSIPLPQQRKESSTVTCALPYSIGLLFQVYNNFYVSGEINPSIYYSTNIGNQGGSNYNLGFTFDNRFALFSLVYRF